MIRRMPRKDPLDVVLPYALSLPGAREEYPWGERVVKAGKKVFAFLGAAFEEREHFGMSVKLPESGDAVLKRKGVTPTGYGLGKSGWVSIRIERGSAFDADELRAWILESYRAVAPKTLIKELEATPSRPGRRTRPPAARTPRPAAGRSTRSRT
jgi:predicted DNA-binding protein (MmcQ/YjbR family)